MSYQIAVCDDCEADTGFVSRLLDEWSKVRKYQMIVESFPSAEAFLFRYAEKKDFDILLLDIEMKGMDGVALAEKIRENDALMQIVFVTGYPDYMARGYDVAALHYLVKPIRKEKFFEVLDRAVARAGRQQKTLLLPMGKETVRMNPEEILYAESQGHYMILHTKDGEIRVRMTMKELKELLGEDFFACGRSFIAGLRYISRITKKTVTLQDGTQLPLGKGLYDAVNLALIRYLREEESASGGQG